MGLESFTLHAATDETHEIAVDGGAISQQFLHIHGIRATSTCEYYNDKRAQNKLAIDALVVNEFDKFLLWPVMGDPVKMRQRRRLS